MTFDKPPEHPCFLATEIQPINWVKWLIKSLARSLTDMNENFPEISMLLDETRRLENMSHRVGMNDYLYLDSRRKQAQKCLMLLEKLRNWLEPDIAEKIKNDLKYILLENWSRQILPEQYGVIPSGRHKTEAYLNKNDALQRDVLEPRNYIGINPNAFSDLDAPSIVTALTPARYRQPDHSHSENYEITFYTGPSLASYHDSGNISEVPVSYGDFAIIPPGTIHSIENPSDHPVMNISIKLPGALKDRGSLIDDRKGSCQVVHMIEASEQGVYRNNFSEFHVPYVINIYDFSKIDIQNTQIYGKGKSAAYVVSWDYIGHFSWDDRKHVLTMNSVLILDEERNFIVDMVVNPGIIYQAELID